LGFEGTGGCNNNYRLEMRQWFSGAAMYSVILCALTARISKQPGLIVQVRDYTAYDDELLKAVVHINATASCPVVHLFAYHGTCWHQPTIGNARTINQDNLLSVARDYTRSKIADGTYGKVKLDMARVGQEPTLAAVTAGSRTVSKPEDYELCYPKESVLMIKQSVMAVGASVGAVTILDPLSPNRSWSWESLVQAHNAEFNPSGVAWNPSNPNKRGAEGPAASGPAVLKVLDSRVEALEEDKLAKVVPATSQFQLFVNSDGRLFLSGLKDADLPSDFKFFKVYGSFQVGAAAEALMKKEGAQFVPYALTPESRVFLTLKPAESGGSSSKGPAVQLPSSVLTLEAAYDLLAAKKPGRVELHKHTVVYTPGSGEKMQVKADEDCCLQVIATMAGAGQEIPVDKLSSAVNLRDLKALEIVHQLQYDAELKKLKPMLPIAVPVGSGFQIKAGEQYSL